MPVWGYPAPPPDLKELIEVDLKMREYHLSIPTERELNTTKSLAKSFKVRATVNIPAGHTEDYDHTNCVFSTKIKSSLWGAIRVFTLFLFHFMLISVFHVVLESVIARVHDVTRMF